MRRHSTDLTSLVFGLIFAGVAAWWAAEQYLDLTINIPNGGRIAAVTLILLGLVGVVASLRRGNGRNGTNGTSADTAPDSITPSPAASSANPPNANPSADR